VPRAALLLACLAAALGGCEPTCPPVPVALPGSAADLPWRAGGSSTIDAALDGAAAAALLDTGFSQSALGPGAPAGLDAAAVTVALGAASAGPLPMQISFLLPPQIGVVIGGEVLYQLPLELDARARITRVLPQWQAPSGQGAPMDVWVTGRCRGGDPSQGPLGPHLMVVAAALDGQPLRMGIDTGADATLIRTSLFESLGPRARLDGIPAASGFAGTFSASATRAISLCVGAASSPGALLMAGAPVDSELDRVSRVALRSGAPLDGLLGWTFLREFSASLAERGADGQRSLVLSRYDTQDHWVRELVGIGVALSADPAGQKIAAFFSTSPARDAGLLAGDVITQVNGAPVGEALPHFPAGTAISLDVLRGAAPLSFSVQVEDLLPDP